MRVRPLPLLLSVLLPACATSRPLRPFPSSTALAPGGGALDAEWVESFAFVEVQIEGRPAGRFLLDTGASLAVLSNRVVDSLALERLPVDTAGGGLVVTGANASRARIERVVPIRELRCGPLTVRGFDAMELDTEPLAAVLGHPVDGVLPATAFGDVTLTIDYPARRVAVAERDPDGGDGPRTMRIAPGSVPVVTLRIDQADVPMLIDTGSSQFLTLPESAATPRQGEPVETGRQQTIGGSLPLLQVRLARDLEWAGQAVTRPIVEIGPKSKPRGSVGAAFLRHFRVVLDQAGHRVHFERAATTPLTAPPVRSTGLSFRRSPSAWTVAYVLDGSPAAAAGLAVGDEVLEIAGVAVAELTRAGYDELVAQRDQLRFRVRSRDGETLIDLPVAVLVP